MLKSQYAKYGLDASPIPVMIIPSKIVIKYNLKQWSLFKIGSTDEWIKKSFQRFKRREDVNWFQNVSLGKWNQRLGYLVVGRIKLRF